MLPLRMTSNTSSTGHRLRERSNTELGVSLCSVAFRPLKTHTAGSKKRLDAIRSVTQIPKWDGC